MGDDLVLGVDVGGTFTDLLLFDPDGQRLRAAKVPTTNPATRDPERVLRDLERGYLTREEAIADYAEPFE